MYADDHIYAGGQGLFETDLGVQGVPILNWREIPLTYSSGLPGVVGVGGGDGSKIIRTVYRIAVLREDRRIVIATRSGVFWSDMPNPPKNTLGCLWKLLGLPAPTQPWTAVYGSYSWNKAVGLPGVKMGYLGLAAGPRRPGERERSIAVASWGDSERAPSSTGGVGGRTRRQWAHRATGRTLIPPGRRAGDRKRASEHLCLIAKKGNGDLGKILRGSETWEVRA